jgi:hypothetical protein
MLFLAIEPKHGGQCTRFTRNAVFGEYGLGHG